MQKTEFHIYNTRTRAIQPFRPIDPHNIKIYVCGPTVYGHAHLGHARSAITFDLLVRTLNHLNYNTTYVRNITDVGHLTNDTHNAEDKVGRIAHLHNIHPMQVAHRYITSYHHDMNRLNVLPPNIEPQASGHMTEQIALTTLLLQKGYAYQVNGSVYFDVPKYHTKHNYGTLSGRKINDLLAGTRTLQHQDDKRSPLDFALWKKAAPNHLMTWDAPWSKGFPGWHLECSAMSAKYLGNHFDIHGGGLDLTFPHHECEIAQHTVAYGQQPANYWMHNNLVTINKEKMSKSANNFITLAQCFNGNHPLLTKPYNPLVLRFFILQTHYRSTLNFSEHALQAAEKGYYKLLNTYKALQNTSHTTKESNHTDTQANQHIQQLTKASYTALYHDLNTAKAIGFLFDLAKYINAITTHKLAITQISHKVWHEMTSMYTALMQDILALDQPLDTKTTHLIEDVLALYQKAKKLKDYQQVDSLRDLLKRQHILIHDTKQGITYSHTS